MVDQVAGAQVVDQVTGAQVVDQVAGSQVVDLLLLLSCVNCHISRLVDASQVRVSSSRLVKPLSPFGGLCIVQSSMMWCTDWFGAPHSHSDVDFRPHLFMASPNLPTPWNSGSSGCNCGGGSRSGSSGGGSNGRSSGCGSN